MSFRYMHTTQEIRALKALEVDSKNREFEDFHFRPRRFAIPNAYDDINRANKGRSWKNYRRTKWR